MRVPYPLFAAIFRTSFSSGPEKNGSFVKFDFEAERDLEIVFGRFDFERGTIVVPLYVLAIAEEGDLPDFAVEVRDRDFRSRLGRNEREDVEVAVLGRIAEVFSGGRLAAPFIITIPPFIFTICG